MNIELESFGAVIVGLLTVGALLKHALPKFPTRLIPLLTWLLGVAAYLALVDGWADSKQWVAAVIASATATGAHSALKNTFREPGRSLKADSRLLLLAGLALFSTGCASFTVKPGADPAVVAAQWKSETALDTFDIFLQWERENEAVLKKLNPEIHRAAETIRQHGHGWIATLNAAQKHYAANRTADNLNALRVAQTLVEAAVAQAKSFLLTGQSKEPKP